MCGRYSITSAPEAIRRLFAVSDMINLEPRYNMAPMQSAPVIREREGARHMDMLRWGLVPGWAQDESRAASMINARSETVAEKPAFRDAYRMRRCLVPADGFYEWRKLGRDKQPYRVSLDGDRPFAFAGLWERWEKGAEPVETFTVLTTEADPRIEHIHHRMPVMLAEDAAFEAWLEGGEADRRTVLKPYDGADLVFTPVSSRVGNVRNDDPALLEAVAEAEEKAEPKPEPPRQGSLF
ncbi:SOS response-associated peptidase [Nisaea acidiphila]|uniref:Abasic site processing protein n=1 Tax=Nisaea acidiphila TaxID=1862145 RepID=A0A9J7AQS2_9PROT|nr:SOS response-associated peptidase [Nisaea acidiphila]UUX49583.1 SOS response-associated peptidase [Nisaea acidiphila]